ncbi:MAG: D-alanyl-D-alanine carboxypeptidase [Lachnospiraceae bacterium]|nr:D-alanyl-D-alanine carboxypeptidase [Lachnospiraceae bacterium]
MKIKKWKKGLALFIGAAAVLSKSMILVQATEHWPQEMEVASPCIMVMETNTGAILYEKNVDEVHYPASITKIMTTLIALEEGDLDDIVTFSADAVYKNEGDTSHISRDLNEEMTLEQCLYAVMLESANECAYAVAEHIGKGDVRKFIDMMNKKAKELGCTDTNFNNPNGLPDEKHYTTTRDMAIISQAAYQNETFRMITETGRYVIPPTNKHAEETLLQNHHSMLYPRRTAQYLYEWCTGGKTGYTNAANSTLVTYAEKNGMSLVCVVMYAQSPDHFLDTTNIFNYCFDNFQMYHVKDNESEFTEKKIKDAGILNTNQSFASLDQNGGIILPKTASFQDVKVKVNTENTTKEIAGKLEYTYAGHSVGRVNVLVTEKEIEKFPFDNLKDGSKNGKKIFFIKGNILLILFIIIFICVIAVIVGKNVSDNFLSIKNKITSKWKKPDPQYMVIRDSRRKWWKRRK